MVNYKLAIRNEYIWIMITLNKSYQKKDRSLQNQMVYLPLALVCSWYLKMMIQNEWYNAIISAIDRFVSGDYGNFYEDEEYISLGHEYGSYDSPFGNTVYDGSIVIHAEKHIDSFGTPADAVIFFWYEL